MTMLVRTMAFLLSCSFGLAATCLTAADGSPEPIAGIGPVGPIVKLHTDFKFTEGPAADAQGNVYFSDIPASRTYKVDLDGKLSIFRDPSNATNGMMFNAAGELVGCEMEGRVTAVSPDGKKVRVLAATYQGKRFNAPNDLVIDAAGGVYFTDPHFRAPEPIPQGVTAVYYISTGGKVSRLIDDLKAPNGVILSPDEKTLYVVPSLQEEMMAYAVEAAGKLGKGRELCKLKQPEGKSGTGGDGLTVDSKGNLYITSGLGLQVFDPAGKALGIIAIPEQPANVTFGGADLGTLYVTARTSLYTVPMEAKGHRFAAGAKK
ncbi:MAG TPA: SMP-30/gluconolactonase/LRE family protein [Pirellulales bacterium]|nr:SMP-30/gluconolactonase/LRE family protein [Pirellulales bacterium]